MKRKFLVVQVIASIALVSVVALGRGAASAAANPSSRAPATTTPIKHLVVIFQENVSFDHYFATYPVAQNPGNVPLFVPGPRTPNVNGLSGPLLTNNPNAVQPLLIPRQYAIVCDQSHS